MTASLAVWLALGALACGNKKECDKSVLNSLTGECAPDDGAGGDGATVGGGNGGTVGGGSGGTGAKGGTGPIVAPTLPAPTWATSFEGASDSGDWVVDNSSATDGALAARPPLLDDLGRADLTIDCGGKRHSLLRFAYRGVLPAAGQELRFYVDGTVYDVYGQTPGHDWVDVAIAVASGKHEYRWEATTDTAGRPPFWLDDIRCVDVLDEGNVNGRFDLDDGYVPSELAGDWQFNNNAAQSSNSLLGMSARAPYLDDLETAKLEFSCGDREHSQLTFWHRGVLPADGQELRFYVDDQLYDIHGQTPGHDWIESTIVVPARKHTYRWEATTDTAGRPPFWVDSIRCIDTPATENDNGRFDFDDGFVPPELTGAWQINNTAAQSKNDDRALSARPPYLDDLESAKIDFSCGDKSHSQLTFWHRGVLPAAGQELRFYVDGNLYDVFGQTPGHDWAEVTIVLPTDTHSYSWEATTDKAGRPPFWIDSIRCIDNPVKTNQNGRFDLDEGFVPTELTLGPWQINNTAAQSRNSDRALSARAPYLDGSSAAELNFGCGDEPHSQLTFWHRGVLPAAGQELHFYVDGELYDTYGQTPGHDWELETISLASAEKHTYTWEVTSDTEARPPFWLDSIRCQ